MTDRRYFASHGRQLAINVATPYAKRTYHALQIGVNRPMTKGLNPRFTERQVRLSLRFSF